MLVSGGSPDDPPVAVNVKLLGEPMPVSRMCFVLLILLPAIYWLSGCATVSFYQQAALGQSRLMLKRQSVDELLATNDIDTSLRVQLELAKEILRFAADQGLPAQGVYESYVETGQPYVIWNVFAAEPFSLALKSSCFPIAGCVSYRGYFNKADALEYGAQLKAQGYDVYVGGVTAYSTLGWFEDPLLDTFLFQPGERLAALLFHELAHRIRYIPGDTRFNESFATAIEYFVLHDWLIKQDRLDLLDRFMESQARQRSVIQLINQTRDALRLVYANDGNEPELVIAQRKAEVIDRLVIDYKVLHDSWEEGEEYAWWMSQEINNAKLETVADYHEWVPVFTRILSSEGIAGLVRKAEALAPLSNEIRESELQKMQMDLP